MRSAKWVCCYPGEWELIYKDGGQILGGVFKIVEPRMEWWGYRENDGPGVYLTKTRLLKDAKAAVEAALVEVLRAREADHD